MFARRYSPQSIKQYTVLFVTLLVSVFASGNVSAQPDRLSRTFADIAKKVGPAVVSIDTKGKVSPAAAAKESAETDDSEDIMDFFRRQLPQRPVYAVGSGFIVDKRGYIITNSHVVDDAERITVKLDSGEEFNATVVGIDGREETDLAILKIDAHRDLPFVELGDSDKIEVGDWVLAIGSPFGLTKSVSAGIISQTHRETPNASPFQKFIQTDAVINPGNSGGPLVNMDGEVIGVNSQIAGQTGANVGIGFAIPSSTVKSIADTLISSGQVEHAYLGVSVQEIPSTVADQLNAVGGVEITKVVSGTPAEKGNLIGATGQKTVEGQAYPTGGDVITAIDGHKVTTAEGVQQAIDAHHPGDSVSITYWRKGETKTVSITLATRPAQVQQ